MQKKLVKRLKLFLVIWVLLAQIPVKICYATETVPTRAWDQNNTDLKLQSESYVLMEGSTKTILYEHNMHEVLPPASITKIMTLLLIFEELEKGAFRLDDLVSVSEHAASMGGSQVFLEPNEVQTVENMIKCISISSANDACVAMAEYVAGTEEAFVQRMNERAKALGMNDTTFVNCCGLDVDGHVSSAYDVALMSVELITKYPEISKYSTTWMDTIVHTTRKGSTEFGLTNTNKLVRQFDGITGLKTGSTGKAKYCLSATANRNEIDMIAVIMAAPDTKTRFKEAAKLLSYGFSNCTKYKDDHTDFPESWISIKGGLVPKVEVIPKQEFHYVLYPGQNSEMIKKKISLYEFAQAPIQKGEELGVITYYMEGAEIGYVPLVATEEVAKAVYLDYVRKILNLLT